jgi:hypothetical protein
VVNVRAIGQTHIGKGALVLVEAVRLERDFLPEGEVSDGVRAPTKNYPCQLMRQFGLLPVSKTPS